MSFKNTKSFFLFIFALTLSLTAVSAQNMWYEFNNTYATDGNTQIKVYLDSDDDLITDPDYNVELLLETADGNCTIYAATEEFSDGTYALFNRDMNACVNFNNNGADFNFIISDVNNLELENTFEYYIPGFNDIDFNWQVDPLFDVESLDTNLSFTPLFYDENGNAISSFDGNFKVYLYNPDGEFVDSYDVDGNATVEIPYTDFNTDVGKYQILVGSDENNLDGAGYKTFTFDVLSFNLVAYVQNDLGESKGTYGADEDLFLEVFGLDLNADVLTLDNIYYQIDNETQVEYDAISKKTEIDLNALSEGLHTIKVIGTSGDYNQTQTVQFSIVDYGSEALMKKNANAGTKERFSGVYAPGDEETTFFYGVKDFAENSYETFDVDDCNNLFDSLEYSKVGFKAKTQINDVDLAYNSTEKLCEVTFTAPASEGEFVYNLDLNEDFNAEFGANLDQELKLNVEKYLLFLDPIDTESAIDEDTGEVDKKAEKFEFFDENLGFVVNVTNLSNGVDDLNVQAISTLSIVHDGTSYALEEEDYDYNYETKLLIIDKNAAELSGVSGGFEIKAEFDTNYTVDEIIESFGTGKKRTFRIGVDLNKDVYDGPPYITPDENLVLVITAQNSAASALEYVNVSLVSLYNFETMEDINLAALTGYNEDNEEVAGNLLTTISDGEGTAYLNLGSGLDNGMYEVTIDVNDGSNVDEGKGFFMVRNFFAFGFPGDEQQGGAFLENGYIGRDENVNIAVFVFSGSANGFGDSEFADPSSYSIPTGTAKLFFETDDGTGRKMIDATVEDLDTDVNWTKGDMVDSGRMIQITPEEELTPGIYEAMFTVDLNGVQDTGISRFTIQGFGIQVCNWGNTGQPTCGESMMGEGSGEINVAPDSNTMFAFNGGSNGPVTLTVSLIDEKNFGIVSGTEDMNYYLYAGTNGYDSNRFDPFSFGSNVWDQNSANDTNIYIEIPANVPLGEYDVLFDFEDNSGIHTKYSRFITVKQFEFSVLPSESWGARESRYVEDWENGGIDTNILDTDEWWLTQLCGYGNTFDVTGIDYNTFFIPEMTGSYGDVNRFMLIDLDNSYIYIDADRDCNFVDNLGDYNVSPGTKELISGITDDANAVMFTSLTLQSLKHILVPADAEPSNSQMQNNFLGEFDLARDIVMPLLITDTAGEPIEGVSVEVNKVKKVDFINKTMETLSSGYTVTNDNNSDENGIVFVKMNVEQTGEYQLELVLSKAGKKEKLMPWEGPVFQIKKFSSEFGFVRETRYNDELLTVDLNISPFVYGMNTDNFNIMGVFDEDAENYDLDGDGNTDKNYYLAYDYRWYMQYNIDDDSNYSEWGETESVGMRQQMMSSNWPTCLGDYNADVTNGSQNDCVNSDAVIFDDVNTYDLEVNMLEYQSKNWSFEEGMQEWSSQNLGGGSLCDTTDSNSFDDVNSLIFDGNYAVNLDQPITIYEPNENYDLNFCSFANATDTNLRVNLFYYQGMNPADGNTYYNFTAQTWDTNIPDANSDYYYIAELSTDWNCFAVDFNIEDLSQLNVGFNGDMNSDHNFYIDDVQLDTNITGHRISFYNRTSYRLLPEEITAEVPDQTGNYMMWSNSNVSDTNHYLEVSLMDRLRNDINISSDANIGCTLIKRGSCEDQYGLMRMDLMGRFTAERISGADDWILNLGDLGTGITGGCLSYELRVDISADVEGTVYKDTSWNRLYIRNNEEP